MAQNIEMRVKTGAAYETVYPATIGSIVKVSDSVATQMGLPSGASVDQAFGA